MDKDYSKRQGTDHFAGTERLASAIGNGGLADIGIVGSEGLADKRGERDSLLRRVMEPYPLRINRNRLDTLYSLTRPDTTAELTYFYHPDHLSSASWITDLSGQPVQHLQYKPFGGDYIDQQAPNTDYSERFRFTGKERDAETGYDYFGARYYSSSLGIWLSVDPMSDKYPSLSPYVYCADNPVLFFDPDGREKIDAFGNDKKNARQKNACARYKDNKPVIHLWAHGNSNSIKTCNPETGEREWVQNATDMHEFLCNHSAIYQNNNDENQTSILVLHSCETGKGNDNIARSISSELDLIVVAPTEMVYNSNLKTNTPQELSCEIGVNRVYKNEEGKLRAGKRGAWKIYYKGVQVDSFDGHTKPIFKDPQKTIEKYEKRYQDIISN